MHSQTFYNAISGGFSDKEKKDKDKKIALSFHTTTEKI